MDGGEEEEQARKGEFFFQVIEQSHPIYPTPKVAILCCGGTCFGSESL